MKEFDLNRNDVIQTFIVMAVLLFSCVIFVYGDCKAYTQWSINIWDALAQGRINEYFLVTAENARHAYGYGNTFGILYLVPWAIWNLPLWATHYFNGNLNIDTPLCMLWSQLFLYICSMISTVYAAKIVYFFTKSKETAKNAFIFTIGAASLMISVGYSGQDEIIYISVFMMGLYYYLIGRRKIGVLLLFVSIVLCNMMMIPVLTFLACYEKNIIKLGIFAIGSFLPEKIASYLCGGGSDIDWLVHSDNYHVVEKATFKNTFAGWFFGCNTISIGIGSISIFALITILVLIRAYFSNDEEENRKDYNALLYTTIILTLNICIIAWMHAYRFYVCVPLLVCMVLIAGNQKRDAEAGMFLLFIFEAMRTFIACEHEYILEFGSCSLSTGNAQYMAGGSLITLLNTYFPVFETLKMPMTSAFLAVCICVLIYIGHHNRKRISVQFPSEIIKYGYCLISLLIIIVYLFMYFNVSVRTYAVSENDQLAIAINGKNSIYQEYTAIGNKLDFIEVRSVTWSRRYSDDLYLKVDLIDASNNEIIESEAVLANDLADNGTVRVSFFANVNKGNLYYIHFYTDHYIEDENQWLYLINIYDDHADKNCSRALIEENGVLGEPVSYNVFHSIAERK